MERIAARFWTEAAEPASFSDRSRGAGLALEDYESLCHGVTQTVGDLGGIPVDDIFLHCLCNGCFFHPKSAPVTSGDKR